MNHSATYKSITVLFLFSFYCLKGKAQEHLSTAEKGWAQEKNILSEIKSPIFRDKDYSIIQYGAKADGITDCPEAFKKAIEVCNQAGGGRVVVPEGVYLTGAIHLKSNVNLYISEKATVKFSTDPDKYLPVVFTRY